ncbi:MAG: response regulator transcription factor [Myxococcota bacterium]
MALVLEKRPDVVLMDINMPRLSGIDATRQLGKAGCQSKILVLSMHEPGLRRGGPARRGPRDTSSNSASKDVHNAIDAVRAGASYLSPAITQQVVDAIARPGDAGPQGVSMLTEREARGAQADREDSPRGDRLGLGVSLKTIDSHRSNLMEKLDIHKVSGLVRFAIRAGLVEP